MPLSRLPTRADFPPALTIDITTPSQGLPVNILILLHGLGDTNVPFTTLGKNLNLPETACLTIRGPSPIPAVFTGSEVPSFHWGDDVVFDESRGEIDLDAGFKTALEVLWRDVIDGVLVRKCGYAHRNIFLYGFGQGGMVALQLAAAKPDVEFGGLISVGGALSNSSSGDANQKVKTPVIVLSGSRSREVTRSKVNGLKERFADCEYVKWEKPDDSMPRSREEMMPIMKFFARRLRSRAGVPEDADEV